MFIGISSNPRRVMACGSGMVRVKSVRQHVFLVIHFNKKKVHGAWIVMNPNTSSNQVNKFTNPFPLILNTMDKRLYKHIKARFIASVVNSKCFRPGLIFDTCEDGLAAVAVAVPPRPSQGAGWFNTACVLSKNSAYKNLRGSVPRWAIHFQLYYTHNTLRIWRTLGIGLPNSYSSAYT